MFKKLKKLVKKTSPSAAMSSKANKVSKGLSPLNRRGGGAATPASARAKTAKPASRMR